MTVDYDSDLEQRIARAFAERAERSTAPRRETPANLVSPIAKGAASRRGSARMRVRILVGVSAVVIAAAAVFVVVDHHAVTARVRVTAPTVTTVPAPATTCPASETIGRIDHPDSVLAAICLPDPAPGFPLRRGPDTTAMQSGALTRIFLVGVTPPVTTTLPSGAVLITPTGPEASVFVARAGAFPTTPSAVVAAGEYSVTGTTVALGTTATIESGADGQTGVVLDTDGFDIAAYGQPIAGGAPVLAAQLVALINTLRGLDAG